jgi:hypothetical protein
MGRKRMKGVGRESRKCGRGEEEGKGKMEGER